jgi:hypothetical protein
VGKGVAESELLEGDLEKIELKKQDSTLSAIE